MNHANRFLILCLLLAVPTALGGFSQTYAEQNNPRLLIDHDDANITFVESRRNFTVNATGNAYVVLVGNTGDPYLGAAGYVVDVAACTIPITGAIVCSQIAAGVNHTNPSQEFQVAPGTVHQVRFTYHFPAARPLRELAVSFHIVLNETTAGTGNGGSGLPTIAHTVRLAFHDAQNDSDADYMADGWERLHFGDLSASAEGDADGDGYNNRQEHDAGTDPRNAASHPNAPLIRAGGGALDDREAVNLAFAFFVFLAILVIVLRIAQDAREKRIAAWTLGIGAALFITLGACFFLANVSMGSPRWAWWSHFGTTSLEMLAFLAAGSAVLLLALGAILALAQNRERGVLAIAAALLIAGPASWLLFAVFQTTP